MQQAAKEAERADATTRGYGEDWRALRSAHLADNPACVQCGRIARSNHVDHIVAHRGDDRLRIDPANLQTLCHSCHSRKTAQQDAGFGNRRR